MAITAMGLGTKAAPEGANLDPQREFWSWLAPFVNPDDKGADSQHHERGYFSGFACTQTDPAGMSIKIGGGSTADSALLVLTDGRCVLLSTNGEPELVTIPTAPATGSRIDAVVSYIDTTSPVTDTETPGTPEYVHTIVVQGTAASNPSAPTDDQIVGALPAGANSKYYRWCDVRVAASQTVITNSDIIDKKPASPNVYLTDGSITTAKLANRAVTSDKIDWTTLDTGWKNLIIATDNATALSWHRNAARIIGRTLYISMGLNKKTANWQVVAYLPDSISKYVSANPYDFVGRADSQTGGVVVGGLTQGKIIRIYNVDKAFDLMVDTALPLDY